MSGVSFITAVTWLSTMLNVLSILEKQKIHFQSKLAALICFRLADCVFLLSITTDLWSQIFCFVVMGFISVLDLAGLDLIFFIESRMMM